MPLPFIFANLTTIPLSDLDANFAALGTFGVLRCAESGTNVISLALTGNTPTISAYSDYLMLAAVAAGTNTGPTTASLSGLGTLGVYKSTTAGAVQLSGGEIVAGNFFLLGYSSSLASGAGGFYLVNPSRAVYPTSAQVTVTSVAGTTLTAAQLTGSGAGLCVLTRAGAAVGAFNDTTDTATAILAALPGAIVGTVFRVRVYNSTGQTQTLLAGAGVTVTGTATTTAGATHEYEGLVTNVGTPAVVFYG